MSFASGDVVTISDMEYERLKDARYWLFAIGVLIGTGATILVAMTRGC